MYRNTFGTNRIYRAHAEIACSEFSSLHFYWRLKFFKFYFYSLLKSAQIKKKIPVNLKIKKLMA